MWKSVSVQIFIIRKGRNSQLPTEISAVIFSLCKTIPTEADDNNQDEKKSGRLSHRQSPGIGNSDIATCLFGISFY